MRFEEFAAIVHNGSKERLIAVEVEAHVDVLRALPAKKKDDGRISAFAAFAAAAQGIGLREQFGGLVRIGGDHEPSLRHLFSSDLKRVGRVGEIFGRCALEMLSERTAVRAQRRLAFGREKQELPWTRRTRALGQRRFFQDDVDVCAAKAKGN